MRATRSKLSSGSLLALLTALLLLTPGAKTDAQSASRSFQMSLYVDLSSPHLTGTDADILMFGEGQPQPPPPARTIMKYKSWTDGPIPEPVLHYDWSRIVAVMIDEPYNPIKSNPCYAQDGIDAANAIDQLLAARAAELKSVFPLTRFWVNFADTQVAWMLDTQCQLIYPPDGAFLIKPYMDVISLDFYYQRFDPNIRYDNDWLVAHRATPQQQLALIPGTFYRDRRDNQSTQASYLQGFFDYANNANQSCNIPLGPRGVTGIFDGCLVWMVMGWPADTFTDGSTTYVGELCYAGGPLCAQLISAAWRQEVALPLRPDLAHQLSRKQIAGALIPQWLK